MLKAITAFFSNLFMKVKTFFAKHASLAETLYLEFLNSEEGKKIIGELKNTQDKEVAVQSVLNLLTEKAKALAENNPKLTQKVLEFLKKKILAELK